MIANYLIRLFPKLHQLTDGTTLASTSFQSTGSAAAEEVATLLAAAPLHSMDMSLVLCCVELSPDKKARGGTVLLPPLSL